MYIADSPDAIRKKFKTAVTDSEREIRYDPEAKPGVSNLLEIMSVATGEPIDALETRFDGLGLRRPEGGRRRVRRRAPGADPERFEALRADERELQRLLAVGAEKARNASQPTLELMYERMGFVEARGRAASSAPPGRAACSSTRAVASS